MKPKLLKVPVQPQHSFSVRFDSLPNFFTEYHFHPEVELVYIHKGTGTQMVGNNLKRFKQGDLTLIGSNLPHLWKCDEVYFKKNSTLKAEATVIHFMPNLFGDAFLNLPENKAIEKLLLKAKAGLTITKQTKTQVVQMMQEMLQCSASRRILLLIELLHLLSATKNYTTINNKEQIIEYSNKANERMNAVLKYLLVNYTTNISLDKIASIANMSTNAFCRYFKKSTQKTLSTFIQELRINHACKLLAETNQSISAICYESGFNNLSNFNRYFKAILGITPQQYKNQYSN